ncbi:MAG: histidine kinase [Lachnospiraceae bacterium]|nr:histidine kinase [Lachnospiraceae bacterium]
MLDWIDLINLSVASAGLMLSILGLVLSLVLRYLDRPSRRFFVTFFSILTAYVISDLTSQISLGLFSESFSWLSGIAIFLESLFSSLLLLLLTEYLLKELGEKNAGENPLLRTVAVIWGIYVLLLIITQFTTVIYYVTDDNIYVRGPVYPVLLIPPALIMVLNLITLIRKRERLSVRTRYAFFIYFFFPLLAMLVQMRFYGLLLIVFASSFSTFILFVTILLDQVDRFVSQEETNARQQIDIMVLQMRPHFIYNTLNSIYYLCDLDPKKAQKVLTDFTNYLRRNFTAVTKRDLIPFEEELEHTRAYLSVEENRYEQLLFVEYELSHQLFRLPPLTLQPIVENAVKHGVDPQLKPLYIKIRTQSTDSENIIIVEDTGPGFDATLPDLRTAPETPGAAEELYNADHIGLANVSKRLRLSCNGTLEISGREGGGTIVTIRIPDHISKKGV